MKLLFVSHQADFLYGGEIVSLEFMKALKEKGHEIHFASPLGPYHERAKAYAKVHELSSIQFSRRVHLLPRLLPALWLTKKELKNICEQESIDIIHATSLKSMVYCWSLRRLKRWPVFWHHHDILPAHTRNALWAKLLAKTAAAILTPSKAAAQALIQAGVSAEKIFTLYNGFQAQDWQKRSEPKNGDKFFLGIVGELSVRKGSDKILSLLQALEKKMPETIDWQVQVIGEASSDPEFGRRVQAELKGFQEKGRIEFLGKRKDIKVFYQNFSALLLLSREDPLPTVIIEALFSGVPVIATPVGGVPEMIAHKKEGFLCKSVEEMAQAIHVLAQDPTVWRELAMAARKKAETKFSLEQSVKELEEHYMRFAKTKY